MKKLAYDSISKKEFFKISVLGISFKHYSLCRSRFYPRLYRLFITLLDLFNDLSMIFKLLNSSRKDMLYSLIGSLFLSSRRS